MKEQERTGITSSLANRMSNFHSLILAGAKIVAITGINSDTCVGVLETFILRDFLVKEWSLSQRTLLYLIFD